MSAISKSERIDTQGSVFLSSAGLRIGSILTLWFLTVLILGSLQAFVRPAGSLPIPILSTIAIPVILFLSAFRFSNRFQEWILSADLRLITGVQAWRFGGFAFLVLFGLNLLPAYFAWPAGLGDMAIGASAPFVVGSLIRNPGKVYSKNFVLWNVLGILDLVLAVTLGGLGPFLFPEATTSATSLMARLPLSLIPTFFVPVFILMHLTALFQSKRRV
ncbi:hypothetical protein L0152_30635 [bacterium]|nr:hypothetical protein [bacterium]